MAEISLGGDEFADERVRHKSKLLVDLVHDELLDDMRLVDSEKYATDESVEPAKATGVGHVADLAIEPLEVRVGEDLLAARRLCRNFKKREVKVLSAECQQSVTARLTECCSC